MMTYLGLCRVDGAERDHHAVERRLRTQIPHAAKASGQPYPGHRTVRRNLRPVSGQLGRLARNFPLRHHRFRCLHQHQRCHLSE